MPEFDNPGHVRAIGYDPALNPVILCFDKNWTYTVPDAYRINGGPPTGVFDPSNSDSYTLLRSILEEYAADFPDNLVHLGGDEVLTSCFNENPEIITFMDNLGLQTYDDLIDYWQG